MISPVKCKDQDVLSKLWLHEAQRFFTTLINEEDQQWFERLACELLSRHRPDAFSRADLRRIISIILRLHEGGSGCRESGDMS